MNRIVQRGAHRPGLTNAGLTLYSASRVIQFSNGKARGPARRVRTVMGKFFDSNQRIRRGALALGLCSLIVVPASGCSIAKPPTETLARAETRLRTATEARADELAPMDLQRARDHLAKAKKASSMGQHEDARRFAEAAEVEAELAEAKADADITRRAADGLRRTVDALRQEIERGTLGKSSKENR